MGAVLMPYKPKTKNQSSDYLSKPDLLYFCSSNSSRNMSICLTFPLDVADVIKGADHTQRNHQGDPKVGKVMSQTLYTDSTDITAASEEVFR